MIATIDARQWTIAAWSIGLLLLFVPGPALSWDAILTCRMEEETGFTIKQGRAAHIRNPFDPNEIVFAGLDSPTPSMKGNSGESRLTLIRREAETVWLLEQPPLGGVNVYTVFRDTNRIVASKQYRASLPGDVVFALTWIGECR